MSDLWFLSLKSCSQIGDRLSTRALLCVDWLFFKINAVLGPTVERRQNRLVDERHLFTDFTRWKVDRSLFSESREKKIHDVRTRWVESRRRFCWSGCRQIEDFLGNKIIDRRLNMIKIVEDNWMSRWVNRRSASRRENKVLLFCCCRLVNSLQGLIRESPPRSTLDERLFRFKANSTLNFVVRRFSPKRNERIHRSGRIVWTKIERKSFIVELLFSFLCPRATFVFCCLFFLIELVDHENELLSIKKFPSRKDATFRRHTTFPRSAHQW